jgi:hypothetical protein
MKTEATNAETQALGAALWAVALVGVIAAVIAGVVAGPRALVGVGLGSAIAVLNLWAVTRITRAFFNRGQGLPWGLVAVAKFSLLFGLVVLLVRLGVADILSLVIGYGALPFGIAAAQLFGTAPARRQG